MRDQRAAAFKAWATRRARAGGKARILPSGHRAMATNLGGRARSGPPPTGSAKLKDALKASLRGSSGSDFYTRRARNAGAGIPGPHKVVEYGTAWGTRFKVMSGSKKRTGNINDRAAADAVVARLDRGSPLYYDPAALMRKAALAFEGRRKVAR